MKFPFVASLILFVLMSCSRPDYLVESDYSYRGNFNRYRTFSFADKTSSPESEKEKIILEKYMKSTLTAWGYDYSDNKPDLLVFYAVYYDDLNFQGFEQPRFQSWLYANFGENDIAFQQDSVTKAGSEGAVFEEEQTSFQEDYHKMNYTLKEGTILISLFDRRKKRTVWQGYASGIFGEDKRQNDRAMRSAIIRIMDEYKLLAFGAS